jgi:outer membrane protein OmpA-like peptidoglycan-associated protein
LTKTAFWLAGIAAFTAAPAQARDGNWYIGADAGVALGDQVDVDSDATTPRENAVFADTATGLDVAGVVGYDFGAIRIEAEAAFKRSGYDSLTVVTPGAFNLGASVAPGTSFASQDDLSVFSGMLNLLLELGSDKGFQIYGGGGIGAAQVNLNLATPLVELVDEAETDIAWQLIAGVRYPLTDRVNLGLRYRYFQFSDFQFTSTLGQALEADYASHSVLASLRVNLGKKPEPMPEPDAVPLPIAIDPAPPAPPVVRPVTPAPSPVPQCNFGPYIVFFDFDQSAITAEAANTLDQAVAGYGNCGGARIMLAGHTDRAGSARYNLGLAERRATAVNNYLAGKGIPAARISQSALGESNPRVITPDGVREQENRRVEITYGPGSGM